MTSTTRETQIVADPDVPLVRITREFDAPPAKVFRAHVDRELAARWIGPHSLQTRIEGWDCRTGGSYRYVMVEGDEEYGFYGSFHEVRQDELIVQTTAFEGMPDGVALEKIRLEDLGSGRTRLVSTSLCDSFADRDAMLAQGMEVGIVEGYEKLDQLLAADSGGAR